MKLVEHEKIDIDCAIEVLPKEASENSGLLTIDTAPHYIEGTYEAIPAPCDGGSSCPSIKFSDVDRSPSNWYHEAVDWACVSGVTKGLSETQFGPMEACTRAQAVTFLWRAKGCPEPKSTSDSNPFKDVPAGQYYSDAVYWAANHNPQITNGTGADTFSPNAPCTRAQIVTFLYRCMK